jgi:DNA polymerase-1
MPDRKRIFLIDGSALAYRSYFAFIRSPLVNSKGENTSATFGFVNSLLKILRDQAPDYIAVAFDTGKPTFRHEMYADYKATRQKMPDDMRDQLPRVRQVVEAMRVPIVEQEGFEADDLIATLARQAVEQGLEAAIVSGDKDFMQLVGPHVRLYDPRDDAWTDAEGVKAKFGVGPERVVDVLALMGDASDNVPGVPKVGEKTAIALVQAFGGVEEVLAGAERVTKKQVRENLIAHADLARKSKELVTIRQDAPVLLDLEGMRAGAFDTEALTGLFRELEFTRLLSQITSPPAAKVETPVTYVLVDTVEKLDGLVRRMREAPLVSVDTETTDTDAMRARLVGVAVSVAPHEGFYIPVGHTAGPNLDLREALGRLRPVLEDPALPKCGQNLKYDAMVLRRHGVGLEGMAFDAMVASYLIDPDRPHGLDALSLAYLDHQTIPISDLIGKGKEQVSFAEVPVERACAYSAEDADVALRLKATLEPKVAEAGAADLLREVEMPLVGVLADMELAGVAVDVPFLREMSRVFERDLGRLAEEIHRIAGEAFNINSTQQLGRILFEKLGLPRKRKTKTGYSTDVGVLEELALDHELPRRILEHRQLAKLKSTYVDALPELIHPETGRIHTSFNQTVTATGRLSSSNPNLQNIPIRTETGREIRKAFVPRDRDHVLLSADYSQIELRILAHLSRDEALIEAFRSGEDIHVRTASLMFNLMPEFVQEEMRRRAKTINYGVVYGMGAFGLAGRLGIPRREAQAFIERYFETYSGVRAYLDRAVKEATERGYVTTMLGRRRFLPELASTNANTRAFGERTATNSPIQGSAADMIKVAMARVRRALKGAGLTAQMILQVHDELVFEVPRKEVEKVKEIVAQEMQGALPLSVPVQVEVGVGENWLEAH